MKQNKKMFLSPTPRSVALKTKQMGHKIEVCSETKTLFRRAYLYLLKKVLEL